MKKFLSILLLNISFFMSADQAVIILRDVGNGGNHVEHYIPADQPDVYYDSDNQTIIIDGGGEVSYYDVEIMSMTTWNTVITTQVNGTYDTIDVSSLASDDYLIVITTPNDNEYEGEFSVP